MKYESTEQKIFKIAYPAVLYFFISIAVQFLVSTCVIFIDVKNTAIQEAGIQASANYLQKIDAIVQKYSVLMNGISAFLGFVIFFFLYQHDRKDRQEPPIQTEITAMKWFSVLRCYCVGATAGIGCNLLFALLPIDNIFGSYEETSKLLFQGKFFALMLTLGILVPVTEELLYRGIVYNRIRQYIDIRTALLVSALAFGIFHFNLVQGIYAFVLGLILAGLYEKYHSITAPVMVHMAVNQIAVIFYVTGFDAYLFSHMLLYLPCMAVLLGIGGKLLYDIVRDKKL